jgi:uncharacterized lipoprotein YmbA
MLSHHYKSVALIFLAILLSSCAGVSGSMPIRYYLIDPAESLNTIHKSSKPLSIEIISLHIPQYLDRFHIATRKSESRLEFSENHQWGESLRKNLLRTMSRNLSALLSTIDIGTPLNRSSSHPDYRVKIHIEQFEQESNQKVKLVALWQLSGGPESKTLGIFNANLQDQNTIKKNNFEQMVSVMRQLFGRLSQRVAKTIIAQEK